ncbi:MAG: hypothetical protein RL643_165, partial [Actinomycetota bacterium]
RERDGSKVVGDDRQRRLHDVLLAAVVE